MIDVGIAIWSFRCWLQCWSIPSPHYIGALCRIELNLTYLWSKSVCTPNQCTAFIVGNVLSRVNSLDLEPNGNHCQPKLYFDISQGWWMFKWDNPAIKWGFYKQENIEIRRSRKLSDENPSSQWKLQRPSLSMGSWTCTGATCRWLIGKFLWNDLDLSWLWELYTSFRLIRFLHERFDESVSILCWIQIMRYLYLRVQHE
jgi:hypothetical protein